LFTNLFLVPGFLFFFFASLAMSTKNLAAQKRMAMEIMKVGQRGVWLDPMKKEELAKAKTRVLVRELIEKGVIRRTKPRARQKFLIPPQYLSRYRQRLLSDVIVRGRPRRATPKPTSGRRYWKPRYWNKIKPSLDEDGSEPTEPLQTRAGARIAARLAKQAKVAAKHD
jgi:hypothetical protein